MGWITWSYAGNRKNGTIVIASHHFKYLGQSEMQKNVTAVERFDKTNTFSIFPADSIVVRTK